MLYYILQVENYIFFAQIILSGVFPTFLSSKTESGTAAMSYALDHRWKLSKSENLCLMFAVSFLLSRFLFYLLSRILVNIRRFCNKDG